MPLLNFIKIKSQDRRILTGLLTLLSLLMLTAAPLFAQEVKASDYRAFPVIGSRLAVWGIAQIHLMFAAFILGVPIFAVIIEYLGVRTKDLRYDRMAREFTKLCLVAFSTTAIFGAILLFALIGLYPKFFAYMSHIFFPTMIFYAVLFFGETFSLYLYWYSWDALMDKKWLHLFLGILLNLFGTTLMVIANSWATFMGSPGGVNEQGALLSLWEAVNNFTWMPINIHRFIANIAFGGSIVAAYSAVRFLMTTSQKERAHYDWMGYTGNFIAICALIPLPFAGYWLGKEIYEFDESMGITLMGGIFSWLFIIQAVMIGVLFIGVNYYLWSGMGRIEGAERYAKYRIYMVAVLFVCLAIWMTPHSLVASLEEARKIGGTHHPLLGVLGVMSAKNTAVNLVILTTFLSFLFYRRAGKIEIAGWSKAGKVIQGVILGLAVLVVMYWGVLGYYVSSVERVKVLTPLQVLVVLFALLSMTIIDLFLYRRATTVGKVEWGKMTKRSQYTLILLAVTFTSLMGLMGYARSAMRESWHIYGVMRDTSPEAFTPTLGYASTVISVIVFLFLALVSFVFWLGSLAERKGAGEYAVLTDVTETSSNPE